jgi:hypothetical protein
VLSSGAAVAGGVLLTAVLALVGVAPAWGDARASLANDGAATHRAARAGDPGDAGAPTAPTGAGGGVPTVPLEQTNPRTAPVRTRTNPPPPTPAPDASDPVKPGPKTPRPQPSTVDPTTNPQAPPSPTATSHEAASPASPQARPAAAPLPAPNAPPPSRPIGGFAPDRVPAIGSQPSVASTANASPSNATNVAAGWASYLPGQEFGVKIFAAGLIALVVSIGGLVTLAIRRRQY